MARLLRPRRPLRAGSALALALAVWAHAASGVAYERASVGNQGEVFLYWPARNLSYVIHKAGSTDVELQEAVGAVQRAFFSWASPSCTDLYFIYDGLTSMEQTNLTRPATSEPDGQTTVIWRETWPPAGSNDGSLTSDTVSVTRLTFVAATGEIVDGDIDLNGHDHYFSTSDEAGKVVFDIQSVVTQEVGHLIGLDFSDVAEAVMHGDVLEGDISGRTLHDDDVQGVCTVYPFGKQTPGRPETPPAVVGAGGGCCATAGGHEQAPSVLLLGVLLLWAHRIRRRART